jgi:hypothetical protein
MKNYSEMCDVVAAEVRRYLTAFSLLLLLLLISPELVMLLRAGRSGVAYVTGQEALFRVIGLTILPVAQGLVALLSSLLVHFEVHTHLDRLTFRYRQAASSEIVQCLTRACASAECAHVSKLRANEPSMMREFYILKQGHDDAQVFDRWARYYLDLYLLTFALLVAVACLGIRVFVWPMNRFAVAAVAFLGLAAATSANIIRHLQPRLRELAASAATTLVRTDESKVLIHLLSICGIRHVDCPRASAIQQTVRSVSPVGSSSRL